MCVVLVNVITNCVQQVGFTQTRRTINEQRVVGAAGCFCNTLSGGQGELVAGALHERFKGVARVQSNRCALAGAAFQGERIGAGFLGHFGIELGWQLLRNHLIAQLLQNIFRGVGLDIDQQLALACPNLVQRIANERHVTGENSLAHVGVWHLQAKAHLVVVNRHSIVEGGKPDGLRDLSTKHLGSCPPHVIVVIDMSLLFHKNPLMPFGREHTVKTFCCYGPVPQPLW